MKMHPQLFLAGAAVLLLLVLVCSFAQVDLDLFHLLGIGREIAHTGRVPWTDSTSYLPTLHPVVHHEWLSGLLFFGTINISGSSGLLALRWLLVAAIAWLTLAAAQRRGAPIVLVLLLAPLAIVLVGPALTLIRAQVLTLVMMAAFLLLLRSERYTVALAALALHVCWLNLHAGFVVGWGLVLAHVIEVALRERRLTRPWLHFLLAAPLLIAVNPWGLHYYTYLLRALPMPRPQISEWAPLWQAQPYIIGACALSWLLAIYAIAKLGLRRTPGALLVIVAALLALWHQRHGSIYGLVWLAVVPAWLAETPLRQQVESLFRHRVTTIGASALLLAIVLIILREKPWQLRMPVNAAMPGEPPPRIIFPQGAVAHLRTTGFNGHLLAPFETAAYVSWHLAPQVKTAIDSRYEVAFDPALARQFFDLLNARGNWPQTLATYPPDLVLVDNNSPLGAALLRHGAWRIIYKDDAYTILAAAHDARWHYTDHRGQRTAAVFP